MQPRLPRAVCNGERRTRPKRRPPRNLIETGLVPSCKVPFGCSVGADGNLTFNVADNNNTRATKCTDERPCVCSNCKGKAKCSTIACPAGFQQKKTASKVECACAECVVSVDRDTCCEEMQCAAISVAAVGKAAGSNKCDGGGVLSKPKCSFSCLQGYHLDNTTNPIECSINAVWPKHPTCLENMCAPIIVDEQVRARC